MVMASCLTVSMPRRKIKTLDYCGYGQLPDLVSSQLEQNTSKSRHVTTSFLTLGGSRRKKIALDIITVVMASCLT